MKDFIYVVHEIEGGKILEAFKCEEDARCFLNFGELDGTIIKYYFTISKVSLK